MEPTNNERLWMCEVGANYIEEMKELVRKIEETEGAQEITAREIMTELTRSGDDDEIVKPRIEQRVEEEAPEEPNAYSDGSLKNVKKGLFGTWGELGFGGRTGSKSSSQVTRK